jgi:adenine nucleotide transporter 17
MAKNITLKEALKTERLTPFGNAVAGAMGAVVSSALVYPLDTYVLQPYIATSY